MSDPESNLGILASMETSEPTRLSVEGFESRVVWFFGVFSFKIKLFASSPGTSNSNHLDEESSSKTKSI